MNYWGFSCLSPATGINIFYLSLPKITWNRQVDRYYFEPWLSWFPSSSWLCLLQNVKHVCVNPKWAIYSGWFCKTFFEMFVFFSFFKWIYGVYASQKLSAELCICGHMLISWLQLQHDIFSGNYCSCVIFICLYVRCPFYCVLPSGRYRIN